MKKPGVLLDRDGTINVDSGYIDAPDRVVLIDGAARAIADFNRAGLPVAILTNQAGVARGHFGLEVVEAVNMRLEELLACEGARVDRIYFCPYHEEGHIKPFSRKSLDRKPNPGMALAAALDLDLDLMNSWVVGDRESDMLLASNIGATGIYVGTEPCDLPGIRVFPSLSVAAPFIIENSLQLLGSSATWR